MAQFRSTAEGVVMCLAAIDDSTESSGPPGATVAGANVLKDEPFREGGLQDLDELGVKRVFGVVLVPGGSCSKSNLENNKEISIGSGQQAGAGSLEGAVQWGQEHHS